MAQRTEIVFTDDLDGSEAQGTVSFAFDGVQYEIDLSQKNADKLAKALEPYAEAGRRVRAAGKPSPRASSGRNGSGPSSQAVRAWAKDQGIEVKDKGRVPAELVVRFQAAGS